MSGPGYVGHQGPAGPVGSPERDDAWWQRAYDEGAVSPAAYEEAQRVRLRLALAEATILALVAQAQAAGAQGPVFPAGRYGTQGAGYCPTCDYPRWDGGPGEDLLARIAALERELAGWREQYEARTKLLDKLHESIPRLVRERDEAREALRLTAQIIIDAIGSVGPENAVDAARRIGPAMVAHRGGAR